MVYIMLLFVDLQTKTDKRGNKKSLNNAFVFNK